jgi:two-component system OmpR family response regulator
LTRLFLLEDDEETAAALVTGLASRGFQVRHAASVPDAVVSLAAHRFDLAVLDLMVPGGSGYEVLDRLRERRDPLPILLLTARDGVADRVEGLRRGADDYLVKPFAFAELLARLEALLRRPSQRIEPLRIGPLEIDPLHRRVALGEQPLDLTRVEFELLHRLALQPKAATTRRQLLEHVWGYRFEPGTNVVEVHIARLRRKLEDAGAVGLVRTVRGVGYALAP